VPYHDEPTGFHFTISHMFPIDAVSHLCNTADGKIGLEE
jgi:hypothetical protein